MGLDMYLNGDKFHVRDYERKVPDASEIPEHEGRPVDADGDPVQTSIIPLGYWRKFAPLHHFIVDEFAEGVDECQQIDLSVEQLQKIAEVIRADKLPANDDCGGFFFGSADFWDDYRAEAEQHAEIFEAAARWIEAAPKYDSGGAKQWRSVNYQASW